MAAFAGGKTIKVEVFKLHNRIYNIMPYINLTTDCHVTIGSIIHCWDIVKGMLPKKIENQGAEYY